MLAGLAADGITVVDDIKYILRGYEDFDIKLRELGAKIEYVQSEKELRKFVLKISYQGLASCSAAVVRR